jgi:RHS repeat-associated protein
MQTIYNFTGNNTFTSNLTSIFSGENVCNFLFHGDHLSSTQMITDITGSIMQQILYAPFGEVISEYNAYWHQGKIPDYTFNAKEKDEESGLYYYSARYYNPPTFISRDPLFEARPWMSAYAYCSNNPINRFDPTGLFDTKADAEAYKKENHIRGKVKHDGESWTVQDRKNKVSIYRDNSNIPMAGKDENGIVTSPTAFGKKMGLIGKLFSRLQNWFNKDKRPTTKFGGITLTTNHPHQGSQGPAIKTTSKDFGINGYIYMNMDNFPGSVPGTRPNPFIPFLISYQFTEEIMKTFEKENIKFIHYSEENIHGDVFGGVISYRDTEDSIEKVKHLKESGNKIIKK